MNPDFISVYDEALTHKECVSIIDFIDNHDDLHIAELEGKVRSHIKDCYQCPDTTLDDNNIPAKILRKALYYSVNDYVKIHPQLNTCMDAWTPTPNYNLQKYLPKQGYHQLHTEVARGTHAYRTLVWMVYLNSVTDGGGTYFSSYDKTLNAVEGRFVIWPPYWTHPHKGIVSNTQTKYIATGWCSFKRGIPMDQVVDMLATSMTE